VTKRATGAANVAPAPRRSGANIPESQRHTVKLQLRVEESVVDQLDALVSSAGGEWNRSSFVAALIDSETTRAARRKRAG